MPVARLRAVLLACVLPPLLSACASVSLAEPPPAAARAVAAREPAPPVEPPSPPQPAESVALEPAAAPPLVLAAGAPAQPLPPADASPPPPTPALRQGESAAPAPVAPGAAAAVAPAPPAGAPLAPGRWSVQVGVFAVEANAQALRERVAQRLAQMPQASAADLRTVRRGDRTHVVVGDLPDRASALRLAAQLRELLRQDLVLFQW